MDLSFRFYFSSDLLIRQGGGRQEEEGQSKVPDSQNGRENKNVEVTK